MPFGTIYKKRRRRKRKKKSAGQKALKKINNIINGIEEKFFDSVNTHLADNIGTVVHITGIAQDGTVDGRNGNQVTIKGIRIRWSMDIDPGDLSIICRVLIIQDTQQITDTAPAPGDILQNLTPLSPENRPRLRRFRLLKETLFTLSNVGQSSRASNWFIPLNLNVRYNGTGAGDIQRNNLYVLTITDEGVSPSTYNHHMRLIYTDL